MLTLRYQTDRMDYSLEQGYDFRHSADDSSEQKTITRDYTTRGEITCRLPGSIVLQSDAILRLRDGYALEEANHSELIWNISAKYSFLKGKRANIEVKFFDLLKRQRNTDRSITAFGYSESNTRRLNSYGLITFSYKFSLLQ